MFSDRIPHLMMNDERAIPFAGLGLYKVTGEREMETAVRAALDSGIRLFDTASFYKNEDILGDVIASCGVPRSELYLTTKIWNTAQRLGDIRGSVERSLDRLHTDYLDLYLIHWPVPGCFPQTWKEMEKLKEEGLCRSIGVSNFSIRNLETLFLSSNTIPAVNQIECHPLNRQEELIRFCQQHNLVVQAYSPLARGMYNDRQILAQIGSHYGKTAAQIGLRWLVQRQVSVIPKSVRPDRIRENSDIFDFSLTDTEMQSIDELDENFRAASIPDDMIGVLNR